MLLRAIGCLFHRSEPNVRGKETGILHKMQNSPTMILSAIFVRKTNVPQENGIRITEVRIFFKMIFRLCFMKQNLLKVNHRFFRLKLFPETAVCFVFRSVTI